MQHGSIFNTDGFSFSWTLCVVGIQSYMYCSLLQNVNEKVKHITIIIHNHIQYGLFNGQWFPFVFSKRM